MTITPWLRRYPLTGYFALAFGISWGGILVVMAVAGFSLSPMQPAEAGLIFAAMALGPSLSGVIVTALLEGQRGLRQLCTRLLHWRVGVRWYAVALLTVPMLLLTVLSLLGALVDPAFAPRFQWWLFAVGILAGSFEEIGWTGFATPRLLVRYRPWIAGLALGLIWAFWHMLVDFRYSFGAMGPAWLLEFAIVVDFH
jgi:membrane protease YdiL (CAAX protease family)